MLESEQEVFAMIVDVGLPDGCGLELLAETSELEPRIPTMVLSGNSSHETIRRAQACGALYVPKPASIENLQAFLDWANGNAVARSTLHRELAALRERHGLTAREAEIVDLATRGMSRAEIMAHLGIKPNTMKTLTRRMLRKTEKSDLDEVRSELLSRIFAEDDEDEEGDGDGDDGMTPPRDGA